MSMLNKTPSVNDYYKSNVSMDAKVKNTIFMNPFVRDLPKIAALNGFYGTFIVGQRHVYFAYGLDRELLASPVREVGDMVYPISWLEDYGYFKRGELRSPYFDAYALPDDGRTSFSLFHDHIGANMHQLQYFVTRYRINNMPIPTFVILGIHSMEGDLAAPALTSKRSDKNTRDKAIAKETEYLKSIAVYKWPYGPGVCKNGPDCGVHMMMYTGFLTGAEKHAEEEMNHPERWLQNFNRMDNAAIVPFTVTRKCAAYIKDALTARGIPYTNETEIPGFAEARTTNIQIVRATKNTGMLENLENWETVYHASINKGFLQYYRDKYADSLFTEEEIRYGNELYNRAGVMKNGAPGCYIAMINELSLEYFRNYAKHFNICFGHPTASWLKDQNDGANHLAVITDIRDMPLVQRFLLDDYLDFYIRFGSIDNDAPTERIYFDRENPDRFIINKIPYFADETNYRYTNCSIPDRMYADYFKDGTLIDIDYGDWHTG